MNALKAAFLGCSLLLTAPSPSARVPAVILATSFCPECWKFLNLSDAVDKEGACRICGKQPVAVDAFELTWYWCPDHLLWHRRPCPQGSYRESWQTRSALALLVAAGDERLQKVAYCPGCFLFPNPLNMERGACPSCGRPLAAVDVVEPKWFWCRRELHWSDAPCFRNPVRHCCVARKGPLHAAQRPAIRGERED